MRGDDSNAGSGQKIGDNEDIVSVFVHLRVPLLVHEADKVECILGRRHIVIERERIRATLH